MRVDKLIEELQKYPPDANARAYEGLRFTNEPSGIVIEQPKPGEHKYGAHLGMIFAHETEDT